MSFGDGVIVEWDSRKALRRGQEAYAMHDENVGDIDGSDDEDIFLEPMDID